MNNDLISKREAIKMFLDEGMPVSAVYIERIPSVQSERIRGKWKEHKDYPNLAYLCSECDYFTTMRSHFCPNCGADMRGEKDAPRN